MSETKQQGSRWYRRSIMAMAMIAVFCYSFAFAEADRGSVLYKQYVAAYTACFERTMAGAEAPVDCNQDPEVRGHLIAHRAAFSLGEPFLNLAVSLTLAVMLSPLLRLLGRFLLLALAIGGSGGAAGSPA
jgi:hypothetical protein